MRIIGGQFKGRTLKTPKGSATRPTQAMLRGSVFNICQNEIQGARFLDLFAGSGAMGLEAISRGASHATLIEKNKSALASIRENIAGLEIASQTTVMNLDAGIAIERLSTPFDIIYVDPPYDTPAAPIVEKLCQRHLLAPNGILFLEERSRPHPTPPHFLSLCHIDTRRFGDALLHQYRFSSRKES